MMNARSPETRMGNNQDLRMTCGDNDSSDVELDCCPFSSRGIDRSPHWCVAQGSVIERLTATLCLAAVSLPVTVFAEADHMRPAAMRAGQPSSILCLSNVFDTAMDVWLRIRK